MQHIPTEAKSRKALPLYSGLIKYFPDALAAVAELSRIGNEQHNPGKPLHWDRSKSGDELDALMRHLLDAGSFDKDKVLHDTKIAWRALANLQKTLESLSRPWPSAGIEEHPAHQGPTFEYNGQTFEVESSLPLTTNLTRLDK